MQLGKPEKEKKAKRKGRMDKRIERARHELSRLVMGAIFLVYIY